MSDAEGLDPALLAVLATVAEAIRAAGGRPVLYGGLAAAVRGRERSTRDIDMAVDASPEAYPRLLGELALRGGRVSEGGLERLRRDGMLPVWFGEIRADLLVPEDPLTAEVVRDATEETVFGHPLGVVRAEHLIVMKVLARRPKDVEDVQAVLVANRDKLDFALIRRWLAEIEEVRPGALDVFERLKREFHDPQVPP